MAKTLYMETTQVPATRTAGEDRDKQAMQEKAERVAWRQLLRWVQAQNAMIECGMVRPMEVFTAYWIPPGQTQTLIEGLLANQFKQIEAPQQGGQQ